MEWISVEDRLPTTPYGEITVIFNLNRGDIKGLNETHVGCYFSFSDRWYSSKWDEDFMSTPENGTVTHWMVIPELPTEE